MRYFIIISILVALAAGFSAPVAMPATINCNTNTTTWCNGTNNQDKMISDSRGQSINAYAGPDEVLGNDGNDLISGQKGIDWIEGNQGWDDIFGGLAADTLLGGYGRDWINTGCRRAATMYASYCSEFQTNEVQGWYHGGPDTDYIISVNGKDDAGTCGPGFDHANIDFQDTLVTNSWLDCEDVICYGCPSGTQARGVAQTLTVMTEEEMIQTVNAWRAEWELLGGASERPPGGEDD